MAAVLVVAGARLLEDGGAHAIGADGHGVHLVASVDAALATARRNGPFDAVVVDDGIGGRPADAVLDALGEGRPPVAVVLSEWATAESFRRSARAGFNVHVVKPCSAEVLASAVSLLVQLHVDGRLTPDTFDVIRFGAVFPGGRQFRAG